MTKDNILSYIKNAYNSDKMFESIMFETSDNENANEIVREVSRFMYCDNHSMTSDGCEFCIKFDKGQIMDFREIGDGLLSISKETIINMISDMSSSAVNENKPKITIIKNAENLKVEASNSLLKFLEEPTKNTFFFLITNNKNDVLPTIKSRSKIILIDDQPIVPVENYIVKVIRSGNKDNILLLNNKMKKQTKEDIVKDCKEALGNFLNQDEMFIYEQLLVLIEDLKFNNNIKLAIDNFLVKIAGE